VFLELDEEHRLVLADIPGLIEGASQGKGLGLEFLRHIERTKLLLHLLDVSDGRERDPIEAFNIVNAELGEYSPQLLEKQQVVVANKIDALSDREYLKELEKYFTERGYQFLAISALTGEGLDQLKKTLFAKMFAKV
jgi:GTP-binding protein